MKKLGMVCVIVMAASFIVFGSPAQSAPANSGEALFEANCKVCHPDGGNIINPAKTLQKKDRMTHNVKTEADIVKIMRNPGPGMTKFDEKTISNKDAQAIAAYVVKTFNK
jgi:cytochrome c6